jgi:hypothetical protein
VRPRLEKRLADAELVGDRFWRPVAVSCDEAGQKLAAFSCDVGVESRNLGGVECVLVLLALIPHWSFSRFSHDSRLLTFT